MNVQQQRYSEVLNVMRKKELKIKTIQSGVAQMEITF